MHRRLIWGKKPKINNAMNTSLNNPSNIHLNLTNIENNDINPNAKLNEDDEDYWSARINSIKRSKSSSNSFYYASFLFKT